MSGDREMALFIKEANFRSTWRGVAKIVEEAYPEWLSKFTGVDIHNDLWVTGNQLVGVELCNWAMDILGETIEEFDNEDK